MKANVRELALGRVIGWEQGDSAERRAIDYFRCHTAISVSSYFDCDFVSGLGACDILETMLTSRFITSGAAWC